MKGLTAFYLLRKTYEVKAGKSSCSTLAAGGVGQIACQWAKALGAKMIGTVVLMKKRRKPKPPVLGKPSTSNKEDIVERVLALTDG